MEKKSLAQTQASTNPGYLVAAILNRIKLKLVILNHAFIHMFIRFRFGAPPPHTDAKTLNSKTLIRLY